MDIFTLDEDFKQGQILNSIDNIVWTERYLDASDFKIVSSDVPKLLSELPLGTYLSHSKTREVMVVEDLEITKNSSGTNTITFTGRSIEAVFLGNRISLPNMNGAKTSRLSDLANEYVVGANSSWHQAAEIIIDHLVDIGSFWPDNSDPRISCYTDIEGVEVDRTIRIIDPGILYDKVVELLKISGSGLKTQRPENNFTTVDFVIHQGKDLTNSVIFSSVLGDLDEVSYFWSTRNEKNAAFARASFAGKYYILNNPTLYPPLGLPTGLDLKWVYVDASSVDNAETPSSGNPEAVFVITPDNYESVVQAKAKEALSYTRTTTITQAKVSENCSFVYNQDYFIGDVVSIFGDYNTEQQMRVSEFSWSMDGTKVEGYPSLIPI